MAGAIGRDGAVGGPGSTGGGAGTGSGTTVASSGPGSTLTASLASVEAVGAGVVGRRVVGLVDGDVDGLVDGLADADELLDTEALTLPLSGLYNAYNAVAAAAGAIALGLPHDAIVRALEGFSAAFGRQERFAIDDRDVRVLLGKNPTGLNQVLRTIAAHDGRKRILFFLNDGIADGRDVSWIWDADYETVQSQTDFVLASGTRAEDLALRLKYAGFGDDLPVEHDTAAALKRALAATPKGATLHVVPTYTAMLEVRELLAKQGGAKRFWEDA